MLSNAVIGGTLVAVYATVLVLQLNPQIALRPMSLVPLGLTLWLFYGVNLTVLFYALIVCRQIVARRVLSPGWLSLRILAWLSAAGALAASTLMWINLRGLQPALPEEAGRRMAVGAAATSVCALALLAIAVVHYSFGRRGGRVGGSLLALAVAASVALPLVARGPGVDRPLGSSRLDVGSWMPPKEGSPHVTLVLLDGASLEYISPAAAEGRLPNFGTLFDAGASMHLATLRPTQPGPVWAAVATGKYPPKHGVQSTSSYRPLGGGPVIELLPQRALAQGLVRLGFLKESPNMPGALRARPLWNILSGLGISVGVVGMPLTHPAQPVHGYIVSDRLHELTDSPIDATAADVAYPPDVLPLVQRLALQSSVMDAEAGPAAAVARDELYDAVTGMLQARLDAQVMAVRYQGLDTVGHRFLRYAMPRVFGDVSDDEVRRHGHVLDEYYAFIDARIGSFKASLGPDDLLLVVSGFGMEPVGLGERILARAFGDPDRSGTHERAPDGFMLAYGAHVAPGRVRRGSVVDVAPTVLYYLGLPVGRDVDGIARTDILTDAFTASRPITFIPTYER